MDTEYLKLQRDFYREWAKQHPDHPNAADFALRSAQVDKQLAQMELEHEQRRARELDRQLALEEIGELATAIAAYGLLLLFFVVLVGVTYFFLSGFMHIPTVLAFIIKPIFWHLWDWLGGLALVLIIFQLWLAELAVTA